MIEVLMEKDEVKRFSKESVFYADEILQKDFTSSKTINFALKLIGQKFNELEVRAILKKYTFLRITRAQKKGDSVSLWVQYDPL